MFNVRKVFGRSSLAFALTPPADATPNRCVCAGSWLGSRGGPLRSLVRLLLLWTVFRFPRVATAQVRRAVQRGYRGTASAPPSGLPLTYLHICRVSPMLVSERTS
jgi:hypothetical protein